MTETTHQYLVRDCLEALRELPDKSVDLVFTSPPYGSQRTYNIGFKLKGQDWVDWSAERYRECVRVCRGLVAWVVEGKTRNFQWDATPALLMADLHRSGIKLRNPPIMHRVGIAGSGGPDWLRNDKEFIVCASHGKLPWSANTVMGHPPKWAPGGAMSHRVSGGTRVNQWGHPIDSGATQMLEGGVVRSGGKRPSHKQMPAMSEIIGRDGPEPKVEAYLRGDMPPGSKLHTKSNGHSKRVQCYTPPVLANPGNVIHTVVGGGVMGHKLAHENEAPFAESIAEFFIRSFCPPGGTTLDPFAGSGTTGCVSKKHGRNSISIDIRDSQEAIWQQRIQDPRYEP